MSEDSGRFRNVFRESGAAPFLKLAMRQYDRKAAQAEAEAQAAGTRLAMAAHPLRMEAVFAEVERRWELHCEYARTVPWARNQGKAAVIESVYRDVTAGLL